MRTQHTSNTARRRSWRLAPWFALMLGVFIALGVTQAPTARAEPPTRSAPEADDSAYPTRCQDPHDELLEAVVRCQPEEAGRLRTLLVCCQGSEGPPQVDKGHQPGADK